MFQDSKNLNTASQSSTTADQEDGSMQNDELLKKQPTSKIYNSNAIDVHQIFGINRVVGLKIIVEGTVINHYNHFSLNQSACKHHSFELKLPHDALEKSENHELNEAQNFLGKRLTVVFSYKGMPDGPERTFVGVILSVEYEQEEGNLGIIVLSGYSPTILLDAAPHTQSFGGSSSVSLNTIADAVIKEALNNNYDFRIDCGYVKNISYSSQYNETHYNYLARMAEAYGEQFFYDGEVLHFGTLPPPENPLRLIYKSNISDVKLKMKATHVNPTFYGYNSSKNEKLTTGKSTVKHVSDIANRAQQIAEKTFTTPSLRIAPIRSSTSMDIAASQKGAAGSKVAEVFVTSGKTSIPFLYPGCTAEINMRKKDSSQTSYFTKLIVTETQHEVDGKGNYQGTFEAVAADSGFLPRPEFEYPNAETQMATVISNTDPQNQGRVQVRFDWQMHDTTDFIRVMTPDAGSSDKVSKNRGFMAIPEVGDQVMVDFIHNHPDRPFVMGGLFHGKVAGGGGNGNNIKSISSKSGNIIQFNDVCGIEIKDRNGNYVTLSGTGDVTTSVSNNATENVGVMHSINVGSKEGGGSNAVLKLDNEGNVSITCDKEITFKTGDSSITMKSNGTIDILGKKINIIGEESHFGGTALATVGSSGEGSVEITGGKDVTIKATKVDIN